MSELRLPPGARVRSTLHSCRWVGTVLAFDRLHRYPYLVAWDGGDRERCLGTDLQVMSVPERVLDRRVIAEIEAANLAAQRAMQDRRFDHATGQGRN